jgi:hypothetical protein
LFQERRTLKSKEGVNMKNIIVNLVALFVITIAFNAVWYSLRDIPIIPRIILIVVLVILAVWQRYFGDSPRYKL